MKIIWTFTLLMIPGVMSSISVRGYSGGGVIITCRYDREYTDNAKYFCRGEWSTCSELIKTDKKSKWVDSGRFSLYVNTTAAVFTVTIRDLSKQDSDTYYCGVEKLGPDPHTEVNLNVVTGEQISAVRGYSGGNIIINYKYKMLENNYLIDVCKAGSYQCITLISTDRAAEWKHVGRFSVHDDRSARLLRAFIRELNVDDSGEYKIIVKVSEDYSLFSEFKLDVKKADCCEKSISLSAAAGGSVNISCKYPQSHSADVKFVCRRSGSDLCAEETSVEESRRWSAEGQMQLYDDREQQLLTGTISHVTQQHSAEYWCGVQSDQGHKSFITPVLISVTNVSETTSPQPTSSSSASSPSSSPPPSSSSSSSSFSSVRTPLITGVSKSSPSSFTPAGSSLIVSLVLVLLVLITVGLLLLFLCKKHQSRGGDSSSQTGAGKPEAVSHTGCDYEEIKDSHKQLPIFFFSHNLTSGSSLIISLVLVLLVLIIVGLLLLFLCKKHQSRGGDSSSQTGAGKPEAVSHTGCDYEEIKDSHKQLPTNPSVSPDCVYATVQKATGDSQIVVSSAEDLNYAVVNFHKKADCPDRVSLRNNQDCSEYTAVNHFTV
ncbi:uncharacterized protein LOC107732216 [Sinocyclocheilus rhinocerous]|uniref:uncharacterized protein LOC107732216 n=1 Tax=Sinocyclocheilus rhinocerous TaxID=307959 RepID=UPI0007B9CD18|nr:PREDICTED: uncharacterized protein LOC107732216 [Sinocyclocheilus rhinocerous]